MKEEQVEENLKQERFLDSVLVFVVPNFANGTYFLLSSSLPSFRCFCLLQPLSLAFALVSSARCCSRSFAFALLSSPLFLLSLCFCLFISLLARRLVFIWLFVRVSLCCLGWHSPFVFVLFSSRSILIFRAILIFQLQPLSTCRLTFLSCSTSCSFSQTHAISV